MSIRHALGALAAACGLQAATLPTFASDAASSNAATTGADAQRAATLHELYQQERQRDNIFVVHFPDAATARRAAISFHDSMFESDYEHGSLTLELDDEQIARLTHDGYTMERADAFIAKRDAVLARMERAGPGASLLGKHAVTADAIPDSIGGFPCYETVEETFAAAQAIVAAHPTLATWNDVGDSWEKVHGFGGHDMFVLKLTNQAITGNKPKLFITSAIHAREYATAPVALAFAQQLVDGYGTDADSTWILDHHEIHFMLQSNPDGRKQAETGLLWRKNTDQAFCSPTSVNRGVDLNRNFEFGWNDTNGKGSSGNQCNETYRGPTAGSEPEVQAIQNYIRAIYPDNRGPDRADAAPADTPGLHIDIHSYADLVLWPWGDVKTPAPNGAAMQTLGRKFAFYNKYTPEQSIGLYPTDGTSDGPSYGEQGIGAFTFEIGTAFFESCSSYTSTTKPRNLAALLYAAKVVRTPYLTGGGPDVSALTLKPNAAVNPVTAGTLVTLKASATDLDFNQSNGTEPTQPIAAAEYYVDTPPWLPGAVANPMSATDGSFSSTTEKIVAKISTAGWTKGQHLVYVRSKDGSGTWGVFSAVFVKIK